MYRGTRYVPDPTGRKYLPEDVKKLVDSVVSFQEKSREIIEEMRVQSTANANEIRTAVEDGKRRMARLAESGEALAAEMT